MGKFSLDEFVHKTQQDDQENDYFELETERVLEVNLNGEVWSKMGAMISYTGDIKFERGACWSTDLVRCLKRL